MCARVGASRRQVVWCHFNRRRRCAARVRRSRPHPGHVRPLSRRGRRSHSPFPDSGRLPFAAGRRFGARGRTSRCRSPVAHPSQDRYRHGPPGTAAGGSGCRLPKASKRLPQIELEGVFSHLASSEVLDDVDTAQQIERYDAALRTLANHGLHPPLRHLANSGAVAARPNTWHNFVRPGTPALWIRVCAVSRTTARSGNRFSRPAAQTSAFLEDPYSGSARCARRTAVGIWRRLCHSSPSRIAVVSVGYGDGLSRKISVRNGTIQLCATFIPPSVTAKC